MDLGKIFNKTVDLSFYLLFFLVPLVMTPWNFELFEFNKMVVTYLLTIIILTAWICKMIVRKQFIFKRTALDIPIVLFFLSQVLSTIFSIDVHTSIWGYYSRFHGGLLSTTCYLILYYAFVANFNRRKTLIAIYSLISSAVLVTLYGIAEHFGIDAKYWVQDVQNRVFSTLGQPNWLSAWLTALLPIPLAFVSVYKKNKPRFFSFVTIFVIFFVCFLFTKSRSGYPAAAVSVGVFVLLIFLKKFLSLNKSVRSISAIVLAIILAITGIFGTKYLLERFGQDIAYTLDLSDKVYVHPHLVTEYGSSSVDIRKVVWRGAIKIFKAYPIFGSGVETFAYSYYQFRPVEHNLLSEWDFLYNKAHNEYLNFLATTGGLGLGTYLLFIAWVKIRVIFELKNQNSKFKTSMQNPKLSKVDKTLLEKDFLENSALKYALFSGWLSILITNFFGFSVVPVAILFFLFPAFIVTLNNYSDEPTPNDEYSGLQILFITFFVLLSFYPIYKVYQYWEADKSFALGQKMIRQGLYNDGLVHLQKAIENNPREPMFYDETGYAVSALAATVSSEKGANTATQFIAPSISLSEKALSVSPRNLNFWRTRAKIYFNLARIDPKFLEESLSILDTAQKLAPTEAKIMYNTGLVYYQLGQKQKAVEILKNTLKIKPNYPETTAALDLIQKEINK